MRVCVCRSHKTMRRRIDFRGCQEKARALKQLRGSSHFRWATSYTLYCVCMYTPPSRGACFLRFFSPPLLWNDNEKKVAGNGWQSSFLWKKKRRKECTASYYSLSIEVASIFPPIFQNVSKRAGRTVLFWFIVEDGLFFLNKKTYTVKMTFLACSLLNHSSGALV